MAIVPITAAGAIDPTAMGLGPAGIGASGPEWSVGSISSPDAVGAASPIAGQGFGGMLADQISSLSDLQAQAAQGAQALAAGQASDPTSVVMGIERARLGMQLAAQVRNKLTDAYTTIWQTQV